jgi:hypothetical protein
MAVCLAGPESGSAHCGPLQAGRLAAIASMRQLRRSSVAESPDVVLCSSSGGGMEPPAAGDTSSSGLLPQHSRVRHRGPTAGAAGSSGGSRASLLGSCSGRLPVAAAGLDVSSSGSFLQQQQRGGAQPQQLAPQPAQQQGTREPLRRDSSSSGNSASVTDHPAAAGAAAAGAQGGEQQMLPVGSPIEGLGALRLSWGQLPVGSRPASAAASLRLSLSEERLSFE